MAVVTATSSSYKGVTVYERQIYDLVGMDTYAALYYVSPSLYSSINYPMTVREYALENVQAVLINSGYTPEQIKQALVETYVDKEVDPSIQPLLNSSPPTDQWNSPFMTTAWFLLFLSLGILAVIWILYMFILVPLARDYM
jgi:hypothetical protein